MDTKQGAAAPARHFELDVVKTLAIVFMVCTHIYENLTGINWVSIPPDGFLRNLIEFAGGPLAAPVFMTAMGVGMACTRHQSPEEFMKRGLKLLLGGFVLSFFRQTVLLLIGQAIDSDYDSLYSPLESILMCDILHFAGLSFLLTGLLKKLRLTPFWILAVSLAMLAGGGWAGAAVEPTTVPSMLLGFFVFTGRTSGFPLALWYVYPAAGMVFAGVLPRAEKKDVLYGKVLCASACVLGLSVSFLLQNGIPVQNMYMLARESYYDQDLLHVLFSLSAVLAFLSLAYFAFRGAGPENRLMLLFRWCGTNLNTIYICQWLLVAYSVAACALLVAPPVPLALVIPAGLAVSAAAMGLCAAWKRIRRGKAAG